MIVRKPERHFDARADLIALTSDAGPIHVQVGSDGSGAAVALQLGGVMISRLDFFLQGAAKTSVTT